MNKNFAFLTSVPQIPEIPDDFESRDDAFCWIIYQMKELNLLLQAYEARELNIAKNPFSVYFLNMREILINEMRKGGYESVSTSNISSLKETFANMKELVEKISLMT